MRPGLAAKLKQALSKIDRPGTFCMSGSTPAVLPGLVVDGLGPVALPLAAAQAKKLRACCRQAPYGKGEATVVDTSVRRVWRLEPDRFRLTNPDWPPLVAEIVATVQRELGLEKQKLESHLYDLLLYEPGSFFLPHRDGEKLDRMVATLVLVLPSTYTGGVLVVRHDGQERTVDFAAANNPFHIHYAAFYADCEHEIRPLQTGYRLCLVYNLTLAKAKQRIAAPRVSEHVAAISALLRKWSTEDAGEKLAITLEHQYTADGLKWDALKGADRAKANVLADAARHAGCEAYLALLTYWETGSAEYAGGGGYGGSYRRRRWSRYDEEDEGEGDASEYEMTEVIDSSLIATLCQDHDGRGLPIDELSVDEDELLDAAALTKVKPEEEFEGYTGNAGMSLDRWYRHAAMLLWSDQAHYGILCDRDSRRAVPVLEQMVEQWQQSGTAELQQACADLAATILARWPEDSYGGDRFYVRRTKHDPKHDLLQALVAIGAPELIRRYLGEAVVKDASIDFTIALAQGCATFGWTTFQDELIAIVHATKAATLARNVRLLEQVCEAAPRKQRDAWTTLCGLLAPALVTALRTLDGQKADSDWEIRTIPRAKVLAGLVRALLAAAQPKALAQLLDHVKTAPKIYRLIAAQVAALAELKPWLAKHVKKPPVALAKWVARCRAALEKRTAQVPPPPADFRRPADVKCSCADCAELNRFLQDPHAREHRFRAQQVRRSHLENHIRRFRCDLDVATERRGSPHTLVCTKNTVSHQRALAKYHRNVKRLATVRTVAASLRR